MEESAKLRGPLTLAIYNPALLKKTDLIRGFVARQEILDRLLEDLRRELEGGAPQHNLIVGQRGLGKTTLLRRLAFAVEDDAGLKDHWLPLVFPEEQYNVSSLGDFWLNCVDALSDALDRLGQQAAAKELDNRVAEVPATGAARNQMALDILLAESTRLNLRILLLVDNLDIVLDRVKQDEEWEFRKVISEERRLHFTGASSRILEALYEHGRAFYDFFQVVELKGFNEEETIATLGRLAEEDGNEKILKLLREQPARVKAVRVLAGGNPRTLALLYRILSEGADGDVQRDLERLLDEHTPLYKARFEDLSVQLQQTVDEMAIHWDPVTAGELAESMAPMTVNQVSSNLNRLEDLAFVEKTPWYGSKKTGFQIAERFFNIWYLMRASRRVRQRLIWLVKFLEIWFERDEMDTRAREFLRKDPDDVGRERFADLGLAYAQVTTDKYLRWNLESASLHAVVDDGLGKLIDLGDLPPDLRDRQAKIAEMHRLRRTVVEMKRDWGGIDPREFWRLLGGSPQHSVMEKAKLVNELRAAPLDALQELFRGMQDSETELKDAYFGGSKAVTTLYEALAAGDVADAFDYDGTIAVALRYNLKLLPIIAIWSRTDPRFCVEPALTKGRAAFDHIEQVEGFKAYGLMGRARLDDQTGKYMEAERNLREAIAADPEEPRFWSWLGNLLGELLNRSQEAEQAFRKAIELDPEYQPGWNGLGNALVDLKRLDDAEAAFQRAIDLEPSHSYSWTALGNLLQTKRKFLEAEAAHRQALELSPRYSYVWSNLGNVLCDLKDFDESERAYRTAIELDVSDAYPWSGLGKLFRALARHAEAEQAFRRAIELDAKFVDAWNGLGSVLNDLKRFDEAQQAYQKAINLDAAFVHAWNGLGTVLGGLTRFDEAEQAFLRAIELDATYLNARIGLGNALRGLKRSEEAEQAFRRAIDLDATDVYAWYGLGSAMLDLKHFGEAEPAYRRTIEIDGTFVHAWNGLGAVLRDLKRHDEAEEAYRKAIDLDATYIYSWNGLGNLMRDSGRYPEAERAYRKAIQLAPTYTTAWNGLGNALLGLNRIEEAAEAYRNLGLVLGSQAGQELEAARAYIRAFELNSDWIDDLQGAIRLCHSFADRSTDLGELVPIAKGIYTQLADDYRAEFLWVRILTLTQRWWEAALLFEKIAASPTAYPVEEFFHSVVKIGRVQDAIEILEKTDAKARWRPLYEALCAVREGTAAYLRTVAPEVRYPAELILSKISDPPEGVIIRDRHRSKEDRNTSS